jgi:ABC-type transport system involved in multi-copper enzyme maturation permease subunit
MTLLNTIFRYPLLSRELTQRAARPRTYFVRVVYGLVLYGLFLAALHQVLSKSIGGVAGIHAFGIGNELLRRLVDLLCWSLLLIQPALTAGVLTQEKERNHFALLMLTRLGPTKVLLEKYLSGLLPMATLLCLAMPLTAITMGYGGVSPQLLATAGMVVLGTWLVVGAWALFCSAWCRTTLNAVLMAYLCGAALLLAPSLGYSLLKRDVLFGSDLTGVDVPAWLWATWPPEIFARVVDFQRSSFGEAMWTIDARSALIAEAARRCAPLMAAGLFFLLLSRFVLLRRAAPVQESAWAWLASPVQRAWARAVPWLRPTKVDLPTDDPVAWRESGRSLFGRRSRFLYSGTLLSLGTLALSIYVLSLYPPISGPERLTKVAMFIGATAIFVLVARSVNSLLDERTNQTLDIMAATPMGLNEVLKQKARAISRYWVLFGVMLGIIFALQGWSEFEYRRSAHYWQPIAQYWATSGLALIVYPPLIIWLALLCAVWWRKRTRAMFIALGILVIWSALPLLILQVISPDWRDDKHLLWWSLLSPAGILDANYHDNLPHFAQTASSYRGARVVYGAPWVPVTVNCLSYATLALVFRGLCLRVSDRLLRK